MEKWLEQAQQRQDAGVEGAEVQDGDSRGWSRMGAWQEEIRLGKA